VKLLVCYLCKCFRAQSLTKFIIENVSFQQVFRALFSGCHVYIYIYYIYVYIHIYLLNKYINKYIHIYSIYIYINIYIYIYMNRSFGPSLVAAMAGIDGEYYHQQYMFWFAPMIGAATAAIIYGKKIYMMMMMYTYMICISLFELIHIYRCIYICMSATAAIIYGKIYI
jgi:hypothetical protein